MTRYAKGSFWLRFRFVVFHGDGAFHWCTARDLAGCYAESWED